MKSLNQTTMRKTLILLRRVVKVEMAMRTKMGTQKRKTRMKERRESRLKERQVPQEKARNQSDQRKIRGKTKKAKNKNNEREVPLFDLTPTNLSFFFFFFFFGPIDDKGQHYSFRLPFLKMFRTLNLGGVAFNTQVFSSTSSSSFFVLNNNVPAVFFSSSFLASRRCSEALGAKKLSDQELKTFLGQLTGKWEIVKAASPGVGQPERCARLRRRWEVKDFLQGLELFRRIAKHAQEQGHHPDLHLENYKHVSVEIYTHTLPGVSENDFILAAQIDEEAKTLSLK
jgi:pterin-4a-carbinolamine dehydratase